MNGDGLISANAIPILGQSFTFRTWFPTALLNCNCETQHALLLQGVGNFTTCPDCRRSFIITSVGATPDGAVGVHIAQVGLPNCGES